MRDIFNELPGLRFLCPRCLEARPTLGPCPADGAEVVHDRTGTTLAGRYAFRRPLGRGSMGLIWEADQVALDRRVAIKLVPFTDPDSNHRFTRGAGIMAAMTHPNIACVHDYGDAPGPSALELYLVMERLEGAPLARFLTRGPLDLRRALSALAQTLSALDHVHRRGYVHRDIKPANLFVTSLDDDQFVLKLIDFGIARQVDQLADADSPPPARSIKRHLRVTQPMRILGTPEYMAPEQILGQAIDHRVDLYAVGVMAYTLIAGRLPLSGPHRHAIYAAHLRATPPPLSELVTADPRAAPPWDAWLARALAKDSGVRFGTAAEMRAELLSLPPLGPLDQPLAPRTA